MTTSLTRTVFFVSDGTGITAEALAHSLLSHFPGFQFREERVPFVDNEQKAKECRTRIRRAQMKDGAPPIVFTSLINPRISQIVHDAEALFLDVLEKFITPLEQNLGVEAAHTVGRFHGVAESEDYKQRIDAINFTLAHDDAPHHRHLDEADVILIGVSRSGKTPTSLYLAMQFGIKTACYTLGAPDFESQQLPAVLAPLRHKLFGLTIDPERLRQIRQEHRPDSRYTALVNCRQEVDAALRLMQRNAIRHLDATSQSIEEIATAVLQELRFNRPEL